MQLKTYLLLTLLTLTIGSTYAQKKENIIDQVIWVVGDEAILRSDIEDIILDAKARGVTLPSNPYCTLPEQIAVEKLFVHQAIIDSIQISETHIRQMVNREIDNYVAQVGSITKAEEKLKKPVSQLREEMFQRQKNQALAQQMQMELVKSVEATPAEIRRYYSQMTPDSFPTIPPQVELQILSLKPPIPATEIERVKQQLRDYTQRAKNDPTEFSLLARLYSEDLESAKRGGELGFSGRGNYDVDFADVAYSLQKPNQISKIVESKFGYHIIQLIEKRGDKSNFRHILLRPKVSQETQLQGLHKLDSIAQQIREGKMSFERAVIQFSEDKNTKMNAGLMMQMNPYTGMVTAKFEYKNLPPEVAKQTYTMKTGEVSDAFIMIDQATGYELVAIVKVKSKIPSHKANMQDDYQLLKTILEEKKKTTFLNEWIAKKQRETYIRIDPNYRNCEFEHKGWIKNDKP